MIARRPLLVAPPVVPGTALVLLWHGRRSRSPPRCARRRARRRPKGGGARYSSDRAAATATVRAREPPEAVAPPVTEPRETRRGARLDRSLRPLLVRSSPHASASCSTWRSRPSARRSCSATCCGRSSVLTVRRPRTASAGVSPATTWEKRSSGWSSCDRGAKSRRRRPRAGDRGGRRRGAGDHRQARGGGAGVVRPARRRPRADSRISQAGQDLLARSFAQVCAMDSPDQFNPGPDPSDITGASIYDRPTAASRRAGRSSRTSCSPTRSNARRARPGRVARAMEERQVTLEN